MIGVVVLSRGSGANTLRFQGRLPNNKKLPPGSYTLLITATNSAGQKSAPVRLSFKIVRG